MDFLQGQDFNVFSTCEPAKENITFSAKTNEEDIKKKSTTKKADATTTKAIAPTALIFKVFFSESS